MDLVNQLHGRKKLVMVFSKFFRSMVMFCVMRSAAERLINVMVDLLKGYPIFLPRHSTQLTYFFLDTIPVIIINRRCYIRVCPHEVIRLVSS